MQVVYKIVADYGGWWIKYWCTQQKVSKFLQSVYYSSGLLPDIITVRYKIWNLRLKSKISKKFLTRRHCLYITRGI